MWDLTARTLHRTHAVPDLPSALRISDGAVVEAASADDRLIWSKYEG